MKRVYQLFAALIILLWTLNVTASEITPNENIEQKAIQIPQETVFLLKLEVVDRTAGQSMPEERLQNIKNEIIRQVKDKYPTVKILDAETKQSNTVLRVYVDVFTAGNRALRFWIGFGAGKAHMKMTAEWIEGSPPQIKDTKEYQRFGAASLRSGQTIELQMAELIGQYAVEFMSNHYKQ